MRLRVVLHAEGTAESAGLTSLVPAPGRPLHDEHLGPVHRLVARCVAEAISGFAVDFVSPNRSRHGTTVRGSMLRDRPRQLRELLTWPDPRVRPDLAIVMVDQDGDRQLRSRLELAMGDVSLPTALAIPVPEFEAWLLADVATANAAIGATAAQPPDPASMVPGEAKRLFLTWTNRSLEHPGGTELRGHRRDVREEILVKCDLQRLRQQRSFERFERDLHTALGRLVRPA